MAMDEPTEGLLLEIGDSHGGIYIESDSDGLVVRIWEVEQIQRTLFE